MLGSMPSPEPSAFQPEMPFKYSLWTWALFLLWHVTPEDYQSLDCRQSMLVDTKAMRGGWGLTLRLILLLVQLWIASVLMLFLSDSCGDL